MTGTSVATRTEPKAQLIAGGEIAAIIPRSLEEMFRLAGAISASGMAPQSLNSAEKVMVAIMAGAELGMAPFQSLQSFAVINGKPSIWGDGLMAVVRSQGFKVREWIEGEADDAIARCEVTRPDTGETIPGEFSVADAKKAGLWGKQGPWQSYPRRMLKMRARAFALRDGAADVLRGFQIREEVEDYQTVREVPAQAGTGMRARLEARTATGGFDADHVSAELDAALDGDHIPHFDAELTDDPAPDDAPVRDDTPSTARTAPGESLSDDTANNGGAEGLPKGLMKGSELAEANALVDWAVELTNDLEGMDLEAIALALGMADNVDKFQRLAVLKPSMADALNTAIEKRKRVVGR